MSKQEAKAESEESNRMWASASFVGVLIIIGLPLWWKTTEVYRVALPYDKISEFSSSPDVVAAHLTVLANDDATATVVANIIEKAFQDDEIIKLDIKKSILPDDLHLVLESSASEADAVDAVASRYDLQQHDSFYVVQRARGAAAWLGDERVMFFKDAKGSPVAAKALKQWVYQSEVLRGARAVSANAARRTRTPPGANRHVVLSVAQPRPDQMSVEFDAEGAVEDYIGSFADELSELQNFTLTSQWLYLLDFDFKAKEVKDDSPWGRHFVVSQERLPQLLTRLEQRAATHVSELPTLHLVLYATPCAVAPLRLPADTGEILDTAVQAFMSPKWGGVVLGAPTAAECSRERAVWRPDTRLVMGTFLAQLRKLLGFVDLPPIPGAHLQPLRSVRPRRWEVDALLRVRTVEQLASAQRTLHSLAQLLGEIPNIVINDEVGASINAAVEHIAQARRLLARAQLLRAHRAALRAHDAAEAAFMEPSLLALLYFPDDQKYAIYIPLFLPIMFPVVLSLKNLYLWFRGKPMHKEKAE